MNEYREKSVIINDTTYLLDNEINQGGNSSVYKASVPYDSREFSIKILHTTNGKEKKDRLKVPSACLLDSSPFVSPTFLLYPQLKFPTIAGQPCGCPVVLLYIHFVRQPYLNLPPLNNPCLFMISAQTLTWV